MVHPVSRRDALPVIRSALKEDVGPGDITTRSLLPPSARIRARLVTRAPGVLAGGWIALWTFQEADARIRGRLKAREGMNLRTGQAILELQGPAEPILAAERAALNLLGHLSGIATLTREFVLESGHLDVDILDTRKTLPGLRQLQKYAVRTGGGASHRMGLYDAVLIKTNHLRILQKLRRAPSRAAVMEEAIREARERAKGRLVEIEVTSQEGFLAACRAHPDVILLDNMTPAQIRRLVRMSRDCGSRVPQLEVSGGVTLQNVYAYASTGVDRISIGRLTHSAPVLDVALEVLP